MKIKLGREYLIKIVLEMLSVIFAVLLALGVSEWRDTIKTDRLAKKLEKSLLEEIDNNRGQLDLSIKKYQMQIDRIDSLITVFEKNPKRTDLERITTSLYPLNTNIWETAKNTQIINYIELDHIIGYSTFYMVVDIYKAKTSDYIRTKDERKVRTNQDAIEKLRDQNNEIRALKSTAVQIIDLHKRMFSSSDKNQKD